MLRMKRSGVEACVRKCYGVVSLYNAASRTCFLFTFFLVAIVFAVGDSALFGAIKDLLAFACLKFSVSLRLSALQFKILY